MNMDQFSVEQLNSFIGAFFSTKGTDKEGKNLTSSFIQDVFGINLSEEMIQNELREEIRKSLYSWFLLHSEDKVGKEANEMSIKRFFARYLLLYLEKKENNKKIMSEKNIKEAEEDFIFLCNQRKKEEDIDTDRIEAAFTTENGEKVLVDYQLYRNSFLVISKYLVENSDVFRLDLNQTLSCAFSALEEKNVSNSTDMDSTNEEEEVLTPIQKLGLYQEAGQIVALTMRDTIDFYPDGRQVLNDYMKERGYTSTQDLDNDADLMIGTPEEIQDFFEKLMMTLEESHQTQESLPDESIESSTSEVDAFPSSTKEDEISEVEFALPPTSTSSKSGIQISEESLPILEEDTTVCHDVHHNDDVIIGINGEIFSIDSLQPISEVLPSMKHYHFSSPNLSKQEEEKEVTSSVQGGEETSFENDANLADVISDSRDDITSNFPMESQLTDPLIPTQTDISPEEDVLAAIPEVEYDPMEEDSDLISEIDELGDSYDESDFMDVIGDPTFEQILSEVDQIVGSGNFKDFDGDESDREILEKEDSWAFEIPEFQSKDRDRIDTENTANQEETQKGKTK